MGKLRVAVVGVGHIGRFHAQKYHALERVDLCYLCDVNEKRVEPLAQSLSAKVMTDYRHLVGHVDAVSITVPTLLHFEVASFFLQHNIHVLLEKPMTATLDEADKLTEIARQSQAILQVGHLERFNQVIQGVASQLERPRFIESSRLSTFHLRGTDVNVVLDLMIHDIDIIQSLVRSKVSRIAANGAAVLTPYIDIANARIEFENGCVANVTASRISAKIERSMRIFQHDGFFVLNFKDKSLVQHKKGDKEMYPGIPELVRSGQSFSSGDALLSQAEAFVSAILDNQPVVVTPEDGRLALKTAIDITQIVRQSDDWRLLAKKHQNEAVD